MNGNGSRCFKCRTGVGKKTEPDWLPLSAKRMISFFQMILLQPIPFKCPESTNTPKLTEADPLRSLPTPCPLSVSSAVGTLIWPEL